MNYTIKDSMFALILRFVSNKQEISLSNNEFLAHQLKTLQDYIGQYPEEEKRLHAFEWIEKHAKKYRKSWEEEIITADCSEKKCPDCPLSDIDTSDHCFIHDQWLVLLKNYISDKISSKKYIEKTLDLLAEHKQDLKIKLSLLSKE